MSGENLDPADTLRSPSDFPDTSLYKSLYSLPLLYVEDLENPIVEKDDRHHFERVLRIRDGDTINISNGNGSWRECIFGKELRDFSEIQKLSGELSKRLDEEVAGEMAGVSVGFCPLKGGRSDWAIAKLTEIGVDFMTPFFVERSVARFEESKMVNQMKRWRKIIREAGMQSRRVRLPEIGEPTDYEELTQKAGVAICDIYGDPIDKLAGTSISHLLVGPEGGFTEEEKNLVEVKVSLGFNVLRAETAAILAGANLVRLKAPQIRF